MELKYLVLGGKSYFVLVDDDVQIGELEVSQVDDAVYEINRTEIYPAEKGRGLDAGGLVQEVVRYARDHRLTIRPVCSLFRSAVAEETGVDDVFIR